MYKWVLLFSIVWPVHLFGQEEAKKVDTVSHSVKQKKQNEIIDSLKKELAQKNLIIESFTNTINSHKAQVEKLNQDKKKVLDESSEKSKKINGLKKENDLLITDNENKSKEIAQLNKGELKNENSRLENLLKQRQEKILALEQNVNDINEQLSECKNKQDELIKANLEKGKKEVYDEILEKYKTNEFDDLIDNTTKELVDNESKLLKDYNNEQLSDIKTYYDVLHLLSKPYNKLEIEKALVNINKLDDKSQHVKSLKSDLAKYESMNDDLKKCFEKIEILDKNEKAGHSDILMEKKFKKISFELSHFLKDYGYDHSSYPYLSDIIFDLHIRKAINPDADISDLYDKL